MYQFKYTESQAFFNLKIKASKDTSVRDVDSLIKDVDILIRKKGYTGISRSNTTKYLDPEFGFQRNCKYN
jgi:hypothetical protein